LAGDANIPARPAQAFLFKIIPTFAFLKVIDPRARKVSDGKITATVEIPARRAPNSVLLRLRHPRALPMKSVGPFRVLWSSG